MIHLQIFHVPENYQLPTICHFIGHAAIVWIQFKTIFLQVFHQFLIEQEGTFNRPHRAFLAARRALVNRWFPWRNIGYWWCRTYVQTHKYQNSNVVRRTSTVCGILSVRKTDRRETVPQTHLRQYRHMEDSLTFGKIYGQTRIVLRKISRKERHVECRYTIRRMWRSVLSHS